MDTACAFALKHSPSEAAPPPSTLPYEYFGLVVYALWQDVELTSDTAITEWLEWAEEQQQEQEGGGNAAVAGLLALKYTHWLLQQLDEEEDDDDEEGDEDEEGSEEEDDE